MRVIGVVLAGVLWAGGAASAEPERTPLEAAQIRYLAEVGSIAFFVGACEQHIADPELFLRAMTGADVPEKSDFQRMLSSSWTDAYVEGRSEAKGRKWDAATCKRLIDASLVDAHKAKDAFEALKPTRAP